MSIRVLFSAGGTAGHIHPALSIAQAILKIVPDAKIAFAGRKKGMEGKIIPQNGFDFYPIRAMGFPSRPSIKMCKAAREFFAGQKMAAKILRDYHPTVVVGTGGYVGGPVISAAAKQKIPILLHEQNAFPGRANRFFASKADVVCTGFPDSEGVFSKAKKVMYTGNPVRESFFQIDRKQARNHLGLSENTFFLFVMGGSLGAESINRTTVELVKEKMGFPIKVVLVTGEALYEQWSREISETFSGEIPDWMEVKGFIEDPSDYIAASDAFLCRAGALTCAEITAIGTFPIMIPYPYAAGNHQMHNADRLEKEGVGVIVEDKNLDKGILKDIMTMLQRDPTRAEKSRIAAKRMAQRDVAAKVAQEVIALCESTPGESRAK